MSFFPVGFERETKVWSKFEWLKRQNIEVLNNSSTNIIDSAICQNILQYTLYCYLAVYLGRNTLVDLNKYSFVSEDPRGTGKQI